MTTIIKSRVRRLVSFRSSATPVGFECVPDARRRFRPRLRDVSNRPNPTICRARVGRRGPRGNNKTKNRLKTSSDPGTHGGHVCRLCSDDTTPGAPRHRRRRFANFGPIESVSTTSKRGLCTDEFGLPSNRTFRDRRVLLQVVRFRTLGKQNVCSLHVHEQLISNA